MTKCTECNGSGVAEMIGGYERPCDACYGEGTRPQAKSPDQAQRLAALMGAEFVPHDYDAKAPDDLREAVARAMAARDKLDWDGKRKGTEYANHGYYYGLADAALSVTDARLKEAVEALKPFADCAARTHEASADTRLVDFFTDAAPLTVCDLRRARAFIERETSGE